MLPQAVINIDNLIATFNYNLEVLIAGADDSGAHLYAIANPGGSYDDFQPIGYVAIGSGALHAVLSLIGLRQAPMHPLRETVFNVYASKRRAEAAPGVGRETDVVIIQDNAVMRVEQPVLQRLDTLYQEFQRPVEEIGKQLNELNLKGSQTKRSMDVAGQHRLSDLPTAPLSPLVGEQWVQWAVQDINYHLASYKAGVAVTQQQASPHSTAVTTVQGTPAPIIQPS